MSIEILIDPYRTGHPNAGNAVLVETVDDYLIACEGVHQALRNGGSLRVLVANRAMETWFDHFRNRRGVRISTCSPVGILAQALDVGVSSIPQVLREDPAAIVALDLINLAGISRPAPGQSVASWALGAKLGSPWGETSISTQSVLDDLLVRVANETAPDSVHPALVALQHEAASQWAGNSEYSELLQWLFSRETRRRAESFVIARLMRNYPHDVQVEALKFEGRWSELCQLKDLQVVVDGLGTFGRPGFRVPAGPNEVIRRNLSRVLDEEGLKGVTGTISGFIPEEAKVVRSFLKRNAVQIDYSWANDLADLRRVYVGNEAADDLVALISKLQPAKKPDPLSLSAKWGEAKEWLESDYFPYHRWAMSTGRTELTIDPATWFEDWLIANFDSLSRSDALLAACLGGEVNRAATDVVCLVVIVDGLPGYLASRIAELALARGLQCPCSELKLAAVPTLTELAKPSLVRGQLPGQFEHLATSAAAYAEWLAASLALPVADVACVSSNENSVFEIIREPRKAMLYLFGEVDEIIHKALPVEKRQERIEAVLSKLLDDLAEACRDLREQYGQAMRVLIVSDHGYTELPKAAGVLLAVPDGLTESHNRVVYGPEHGVADIPGGLPIASQMLGGGATTYVVARNYNYFGARPRGATHGGLTPQEVVVPLVILTDEERVQFLDCETAISGAVHRGRCDNAVEISIANPNSFSVSVESIELRLTAVKENGPWSIPAGGSVCLASTVDASNVRGRDVQIAGSLVVRGAVGRRTIQVNVRLETTGAALADTKFEDGFDI